MTVAANSYGTADDVVAFAKRFADDSTGVFTTTTRPTLGNVESWIDDVSATLNVLFAELDFTIPISQADCKLVVKHFVVTQVADLCNYANSTGRFFDNDKMTGGPWAVV